MLRRSLLALEVLGLAVLLPAAASAQDAYRDQVLEILAEVSSFAADQGYTQTGEKLVSALAEGTAEDHYIDFVDGRDYVMVAVCDQDCSDIDLHLYGANDELVGADEEPDDVPVIELGNVAGGTHRLEVGMYTCSEEPCYYAVGIYTRAASGGGPAYGGGDAGGGEAYEDQVRERLEMISSVARDNGYTFTGTDWVSALGASESEDQSVALSFGVDYAVVAVCDQDCEDIDLAIYEPSGRLIVEDTEPDATPVLELHDAASGVHRIEVRMYTCNNEPCYYAMGLYKRTGEFWLPVVMESKRR